MCNDLLLYISFGVLYHTHPSPVVLGTHRAARKKMKEDSPDEPPLHKSGLLGKKTEVVEDEVVEGEYGLVINGHSLVRAQPMLLFIVYVYVYVYSIGSL